VLCSLSLLTKIKVFEILFMVLDLGNLFLRKHCFVGPLRCYLAVKIHCVILVIQFWDELSHNFTLKECFKINP